MSARRGDLVDVYDARDLGGHSSRIGIGLFLESKGTRYGEPFEEIRVMIDGKQLQGPYTTVVLQRANLSTTE